MPKNNMAFEEAIARIEEIVNILENNKSSLDESLKLFEEATTLCSFCNNKLNEAQSKINEYTLVEENKVNQWVFSKID